MRAGALDRRVIVQRSTSSYSESGAPIKSWATIGSMRWALRFAVAGTERYSAEQLAALEQVEFRLRWSNDLADLQPQDRIIEPASDEAGDLTPGRSIYDIIGVHEIGRNVALRVLTTRRVDSDMQQVLFATEDGEFLLTEDGEYIGDDVANI